MTYPLPGLPARHEQFEILTARVSRAPGGGDALGRMIQVQWDRGSKRKLLEVSCVVPKSQAATEALKRLFAADLARAVGGLRGPESLNATRTEPGSIVRGLARLHSPGAQFTGDIIWCSYWEQGDQLICDGVPCTNEAELRWHDVDRIAADIWYECTNGCYVERGTGFWCPWGSGGGVGEGEDPGEGGGIGGGESGQSDPEWCPTNDPYCLLDLRQRDHERIDSALAGVNRNLPECAEAVAKIEHLYSIDRVYRGNPLIPDTSSGHNTHDAQTKLGENPLVHVDQNYLDSAQVWGLAQLLLHEGWHLAGHSHPNWPTATYPYTGYPPFDMMVTCAPQANYVNQ